METASPPAQATSIPAPATSAALAAEVASPGEGGLGGKPRGFPLRRIPERVQSLVLGIGFPIALVILWHQLVVMTGTRLVPTPYQVGTMMYDFAIGGIHEDEIGRAHV